MIVLSLSKGAYFPVLLFLAVESCQANWVSSCENITYHIGKQRRFRPVWGSALSRQSLRWSLKWAASWQNQQCGCASSEDSDQPGHPPSLIRVFAVRMKKTWVLSYPLSAQRRLCSDWVDAQADLNLRWAHSDLFGFVTRWLIYWAKDER